MLEFLLGFAVGIITVAGTIVLSFWRHVKKEKHRISTMITLMDHEN